MRTSTRLYIILGLLLLLVLSNGLFLHLRIRGMEGNARAVNMAGMVRGSMQRAAKLVLAGEDARPVMDRVDCWLGLEGSRGEICEAVPLLWDDQPLGYELVQRWKRFKRVVSTVDVGSGGRRLVVDESEVLWSLADLGVLVEQVEAESELLGFRSLYALLGLDVLVLIGIGLVVRRMVQSGLERQAVTDSLTGVLNHRGFQMMIERHESLARRNGKPLCLIILDLDHFKLVNDRHGHGVGDDVLTRIAGLLSGTVRQSDTVCRIGGEEFAVICPETSEAQGVRLAEKLRRAAKALKHAAAGRVTVSLGVAELAPGESPGAWRARADDRLYEAKRTGRDRVVPLPESMPESMPDSMPGGQG